MTKKQKAQRPTKVDVPQGKKESKTGYKYSPEEQVRIDAGEPPFPFPPEYTIMEEKLSKFPVQSGDHYESATSTWFMRSLEACMYYEKTVTLADGKDGKKVLVKVHKFEDGRENWPDRKKDDPTVTFELIDPKGNVLNYFLARYMFKMIEREEDPRMKQEKQAMLDGYLVGKWGEKANKE